MNIVAFYCEGATELLYRDWDTPRLGGLLCMAATRYPNVRRFLAAPYNSLPDQMVERVISAQGLEAGAIEDFWSDLGNVAAAALPVVGGVVGSIVPGVGTALGAGLGAVGGAALHAAIGSGQPSPPPPPPAQLQQMIPGLIYPGGFSGVLSAAYPAAPAVTATSQQSAAQLLQLLTRPELLQALLQMLLGGAGQSYCARCRRADPGRRPSCRIHGNPGQCLDQPGQHAGDPDVRSL